MLFAFVGSQKGTDWSSKALGHSIGAIARPKTVWRELSRNRLPSGRYFPLHAAGAYQLRRRHEARLQRDRALRTFLVDRLAEGLSAAAGKLTRSATRI
jgi:IS30 family transposase